MKSNMEPELEHDLDKIEKDLGEIKNRTGGWRSFLYGLLQGAGWVVGTVVAVALIGWILSVSGVIPGMGKIAENLDDILNRTR